MSRRKEIVTAAGTLICALGIGFVMQSSDTAARYSTPAKASSDVVAPQPDDTLEPPVNASLLDVQDITLTSALPGTDEPVTTPDATEAPVMVKVASLLPTPQPEPQTPVVPEAQCEIHATAKPASDMFADVSLKADCLPNERVTVHHSGMMFTAVTDRSGRVDLSIPALSESAVFIFAFANGEGAVAEVKISGAEDFKRVVLQWRGKADFQLHAMEFGASYDENGHVWRDSNSMGYRSNGYLTRLGRSSVADPLMAEVYTFPIKTNDTDGTVSFSIEAQVSSRNCGKQVEAQSIEMTEGGRLRTRDMAFEVPGCEALGDYLVLNSVFEDLTIAAR